jgi:hypothetical protein
MKENRITKYTKGRDGKGEEYGKWERMGNIKEEEADTKTQRKRLWGSRPRMHLCCPQTRTVQRSATEQLCPKFQLTVSGCQILQPQSWVHVKVIVFLAANQYLQLLLTSGLQCPQHTEINYTTGSPIFVKQRFENSTVHRRLIKMGLKQRR